MRIPVAGKCARSRRKAIELAGQLTTGVRSLPTREHDALEAGLSARRSSDPVLDHLFRGLGDLLDGDALDQSVFGRLGSTKSDHVRADDDQEPLDPARPLSILVDDLLGLLIDKRGQPIKRREAEIDDWFADLGDSADLESLSDDKADSNRRFAD